MPEGKKRKKKRSYRRYSTLARLNLLPTNQTNILSLDPRGTKEEKKGKKCEVFQPNYRKGRRGIIYNWKGENRKPGGNMAKKESKKDCNSSEFVRLKGGITEIT